MNPDLDVSCKLQNDTSPFCIQFTPFPSGDECFYKLLDQ